MPTISSLVSRAAGAHEQGRVQGAASAIESLSRTLGPVWGALVAAAIRRSGAVPLGGAVHAADVGDDRRLSRRRSRAAGGRAARVSVHTQTAEGAETAESLRSANAAHPAVDLIAQLSVRPHQAEDAAQSVERLNYCRDQRRIGAVAGKDLTGRDFKPADQGFCLLAFFVGHALHTISDARGLSRGWLFEWPRRISESSSRRSTRHARDIAARRR